jgi:O-methyltransferase
MSLKSRVRRHVDRWKSRLSGEPAAIEDAVENVIQRMNANHLTVSWGDRLLTIDKTAGFLDEPRFAKAYAEIRGAHQYDQYGGNHTIAWRLNTLCWAARKGLQLQGDFVECGVFKGDMAWVILNVLGYDAIPENYYLYDSFEGFSEKYSSAADYPLSAGFLDFANKHYRVTGIYESVVNRFKPFPKVKVIKGFLPEALDQACPERISFLHVDLNSPAAEVAVLERLFDRVSPGGAIVFDDYGWKLFEKQKIAEDEFMRARGYEILELPTGQGLVIK